MFQSRWQQQGVLLGVAGGLGVVAGGLIVGYFLLGPRNEARAATTPAEPVAAVAPAAPPTQIADLLKREVELVTAHGPVRMTWGELGAAIDTNELADARGDVAGLAAKASLPVRIDRDKAVQALRGIKAQRDVSAVNAYLDLEERKIHDDRPGMGLDIWASLPRLEAGARQAAGKLELANIAVPATVTKQTLGIDDISTVMGHYITKFAVTDRDRNFNLKLAASKLNGVVLKPGQELSFNDTVGERSEQQGYKVAHVITAGEMVDGLAGGTCQISTTLFGAAFFAGIDIVKTINHSRPSAYTPLGFDATVVWPNVDLKIKNPYEFPVVIHFRVANGEAVVEILGKQRPYEKIVFERKVLESFPYPTEERLDAEIPVDITSVDQHGFNGYKIERLRKFYRNGKVVKTNKWVLDYKPVTEYVRRGTSTDPAAVAPKEKPPSKLVEPKGDEFKLAQ